MTQHHLNLCCSYGIPVVVVFTKVDGCPEHALSTSRKEVAKLLKSPEINKRPFQIKSEADVTTCIGKLASLAPTIDVSCVSGHGLGLLRKLLFTLPKRRRHEKKVGRPFEFLVEDVFVSFGGFFHILYADFLSSRHAIIYIRTTSLVWGRWSLALLMLVNWPWAAIVMSMSARPTMERF